MMTEDRERRLRRDRLRFASLRESVAARLWPLPVAAIAVAVGLGVTVPLIDAAVDRNLSEIWTTALFSGGSAAARAVLAAIASSLVAATTLTFSLTVVALQLASSQASPRVLRMFARDPVVHRTLAVFLGTFAFALTVLRSVRDADDPAPAVVPSIAITLAYLLTLLSVVMLVLFLSHLARQLRIETVLRDVHEETSATIALVSDGDHGDTPAPPARPTRPAHARLVAATHSGFLTTVDRNRMVAVAVDHDLVAEELRTIGSDVVEGTPLVAWWNRDPARRTADDEVEQLNDDLRAAFTLAYERTPTQDIGFGLRQLADIATRALSPGVNDPTTAVHALGHISAVLCALARQPLQRRVLSDDEGAPRLVVSTHDFDELVELGIAQARRYGSGDPEVAARLYLLMRELAWSVERDEQRQVVVSQRDRLDIAVAQRDHDRVERERFARLSADVDEALAKRWG